MLAELTNVTERPLCDSLKGYGNGRRFLMTFEIIKILLSSGRARSMWRSRASQPHPSLPGKITEQILLELSFICLDKAPGKEND